MASNTSHYNLVKPAYDEAADIAVINSDMDSIDTQMYKNETGVKNLQEAIAIVSIGNTHAYIASGQYVYVKDHSTLSDGLYVAKSNINQNSTLSTSNLNAVSGGGLNSLNSKLSDNTYSTSGLSYTGCSYADGGYTKVGNIVIINIRVSSTSSTTLSVTGFPKYRNKTANQKNMVAVSVYSSNNDLPSGCCALAKAGTTACEITAYKVTSGDDYILSCVYICD